MEPTRLALALGCLSLPPNDVFAQHLARLLQGAAPRRGTLSVAAGLDRAVARVSGPRSSLLPALRAVLEQHERQLSSAPAGDPLGVWVEAGGEAFDAGWWCPGPLPLPEALDAAPANEARTRLRSWAQEAGVTTCARLLRALGGGNPFTSLHLALPGDGIRAQLDGGLAACRALGVAPPAMGLLAPLVVEPPRRLALTVDLTARSLSRVGFSATGAHTALLLGALDALGRAPLDHWAALEAALAAEGPSEIWVGRSARGDELEATYELTEEEGRRDGDDLPA